MPKLKIACVLKSGGVYDQEYVTRLTGQIAKHIDSSWRLFCFTDMAFTTNEPFTYLFPIRLNLNGTPPTWAKLEIFRVAGCVIYFDLDTMILGSLKPFVDEVMTASQGFYMQRAFNQKQRVSGALMAWVGDWSWLLSSFNTAAILMYGKWEQTYIRDMLEARGVRIRIVDDYLPGIYSYRHHCKKQIPEDARIINFHGQTKPRDIGWRLQ